MKRFIAVLCFLVMTSAAMALKTDTIQSRSNPTNVKIIATTEAGSVVWRFYDAENVAGKNLSDLGGGASAHDDLTGLTENDHTQYLYSATTSTIQEALSPVKFSGSQFLINFPTTCALNATTTTLKANYYLFQDASGNPLLLLYTTAATSAHDFRIMDNLAFTYPDVYIGESGGELIFYDQSQAAERTLSDVMASSLWEEYNSDYYRLADVPLFRITTGGILQTPKQVVIDQDSTGGDEPSIYFGAESAGRRIWLNSNDRFAFTAPLETTGSIVPGSGVLGVAGTISSTVGLSSTTGAFSGDVETTGTLTMNDLTQEAQLGNTTRVGTDDSTDDLLYIGAASIKWAESGKDLVFFNGYTATSRIDLDNTFITLQVGAGYDIQAKCGGYFYVQDYDAAGATRFSVDTATGDVTIYGDLVPSGGTLTVDGDLEATDIATEALTATDDVDAQANVTVGGQLVQDTVSVTANSNGPDVTSANVVFGDATSAGGNIYFKGLAGGTAGQVVFIVNNGTANNVGLYHEDASGTQQFRTFDGNTIYLSPKEQATAIYDGSYWYAQE